MLRGILLYLSGQRRLAHFVTHNGASRRMARRFVAGESLEEALAAARALNQAGRMVSLDCLGENVTNDAAARQAAESYAGMFDRIAGEKLDANVSLKLTQLGLDLSETLCQDLLESIIARAA